MNLQTGIIVSITNKEIIHELSLLNRSIMGVDRDPFYGAPVVLLVLVKKHRNAVYDGSCMIENMMLEASSIGLGSCWINREREMFATDEGKALMKQMGLPDGLVGIGSIALGYPASYPPTVKPRKDGYARVIR